MMNTARVASFLGVLLIILVTLPIVPAARAIDLISVDLGVLVRPVKYPCPVKKSAKWSANDWDTVVVIQHRDVRSGDRVRIEVVLPTGRTMGNTHTWHSYTQRGCTWLFVPILGTDAEAWLGVWRAAVLLNDNKVAGIEWEVTAPSVTGLGEYQTYLATNPDSARAHYQVGAAAALAGQDGLAESELKEAARLAPTWWYPYLALARLYQRQGKRESALDQFNFLKGLLLGLQAEEGSFTEYIKTMLEDHLKQLE